MRAWAALPLLLAAVAGCSSGPASPPPVESTAGPQVVPYVPPAPEPDPTPPGPRHESGRVEVYGTNVAHCPAGNAVVVEHHWAFLELRRRDGDSSLAVALEWHAVNPTANELQLLVRDRPGPNGPVYLEQWGPSPQEFTLFARDLAAWNETMHLQVGVDGCPPEVAVGVHVVPSDEPQPVDWRMDWNTLTDA